MYADFEPALAESVGARPVLSALWEHWAAAKRETDGFPGRASIDPLTLPTAAWRHCFLIEIDGGDYRVRLFGTFMVDLIGKDMTGQRLARRIEDFDRRGGFRVFGEVVREAKPILWRHRAAAAEGPGEPLMETLLLPLFGPDRAVAMIYGASILPTQTGVPSAEEAGLKDRLRSVFARGRIVGETAPKLYEIAV